MKNKKPTRKQWTKLGAIVILILAALLIYKWQASMIDQGIPAAITQQTDNSQTDESANTPPAQVNTNTSAPKNSLSYTAALKKYGSNRIQFDPACQARPNSAVFKAGTNVMFDNRANVSRKITFNGHTYNIAAYGYTVVSMTASKYPATVYANCGTSKNVLKVTIEK